MRLHSCLSLRVHITDILPSTGASGYVGGQVLRELVRGHPEYAITALVRDTNSAATISQGYPKIRTVIGDLNDGDLVEKEASQASVVVRTCCDSKRW